MSKISVFALPVPQKVRESKTFIDPLIPSQSLMLTFEVDPDYATIVQSQTLGQKYARERSGPNSIPISVGEGSSRVSFRPTAGICMKIGIIQTLESPETHEERYSFEEWVAISKVMPNAFADVITWCDQLIEKAFAGKQSSNVGQVPVPNDLEASGETTSEPPLNTEQEIIPTISLDKTPSP